MGEKLGERVNELFSKLELNEKPKFTARSVGEAKPWHSKRPIKVTMRMSAIAKKILSKSSKLRGSEKFSNVYVSPDRTFE